MKFLKKFRIAFQSRIKRSVQTIRQFGFGLTVLSLFCSPVAVILGIGYAMIGIQDEKISLIEAVGRFFFFPEFMLSVWIIFCFAFSLCAVIESVFLAVVGEDELFEDEPETVRSFDPAELRARTIKTS